MGHKDDYSLTTVVDSKQLTVDMDLAQIVASLSCNCRKNVTVFPDRGKK
jgi:hypothetical protein